MKWSCQNVFCVINYLSPTVFYFAETLGPITPSHGKFWVSASVTSIIDVLSFYLVTIMGDVRFKTFWVLN